MKKMEATGERYVPYLNGQIKYEHLHRYALSLEFSAGKSVLDLASGEGYGCVLLAQVAQSVIGVDIDSEAVEYANQQYNNYQNLKFLVGACDSIPLPNQSVDLVTSFETIEHHDKHEEMMLEIKRVLKPGGNLIISSPNRLIYSDEPNYSNPFHVKELYYDELGNLLKRYFKYVQIYGQRLATGSFIFSLENSNRNSFKSYTGSISNLTNQVCNLDAPIYFVAVCSDETDSVQQAIDSVYIDSSDDLLKAIENGWHQTRHVLEGSQAQLQHAQSELNALQAQLQHAQSELNGSQAQLQHAQSELNGSQAQLQHAQSELNGSQAQLQQTQIELERSQSQLQQTKGELERSQSQLQQAKAELERSQSQLQQTQIEFERSQSQLQQTKAELERSQSQLQQTQIEFERSQSQLQQTQIEFERSQSQLQQTQIEFERSQSQLQQSQIELERSQSQLQQTKAELERSQSQLQQTQIEFERSQSQLQQSQIELERSQSQLQQTKAELERSQSQLQQTKAELERSQCRITAMESSKFWKLRTAWFRLKKLIRMKVDE